MPAEVGIEVTTYFDVGRTTYLFVSEAKARVATEGHPYSCSQSRYFVEGAR